MTRKAILVALLGLALRQPALEAGDERRRIQGVVKSRQAGYLEIETVEGEVVTVELTDRTR